MRKRFLLFLIALALCIAQTAVFAAAFHFTVTADPRGMAGAYDNLLAQMKEKIGGQGVFQVSPGDIDPPAPLRAKIDARFGKDAVWYPGIGNHEKETVEDMAWLRAEFASGNGVRIPLREFTNDDGPMGSRETTYSWDYGNARFIMLNQYWNGGSKPGSDAAGPGDIGDALYNWLKKNLAKNKKPVVFVFGHEPAFPKIRHVGDSLDLYPARRDRFWRLLESTPAVKAFICGHTHYYSKFRRQGGRVWQIDVGNAGNDGGDGKTFLDVTVSDTDVRFDAWRDKGTGKYSLEDTWKTMIGD